MIARGDERAVSALIGAVLLLGILVTALALYQVNVVPQENAEVEFNHNERAHGEMQAVRNAIRNTGNDKTARSASVQLGTQYPNRWLTINPPNPSGTISTTEPGTFQIDNAVVDGGTYDSDTSVLFDSHETVNLVYEPHYSEYQNAPTTRLESSFGFNDFDNTQISITDQRLVRNQTINVVLLEGEISQRTTGSVSIDTEIVSGPTTGIPISGDGDPIEITIPTDSPAHWNRTLGDDFDTGEPYARVPDFEEDDESVTIELRNDDDEVYTLQMARVTLGSGDDGGEFNIDSADEDAAAGGAGLAAFNTTWADSQPLDSSSADDIDYEITEGDEETLRVETTPTADNVPVEFGVSDQDRGTVDPTNNTESDGTATTTFEAEEGAGGTTVDVYTWAGGSGDSIRIEILEDEDGEEEPSEAQFESLEATAESVDNITIEFTVSNESTITFTATESGQNEGTATSTVTDTDGTVTLDNFSGGGGNRAYNVSVVADIDDGECLETELAEDGQTNPIGDWNECN